MKNFSIEEGFFQALFFFIAIIILFIGPTGLLTIPGIISGILGIILALKNRQGLCAIIGVLSATASFTGQGLTAFCVYCASAATLFALGGLFSMTKIMKTKPLIIILCLPLVISITFLSYKTSLVDARTNKVVVMDQSQNPVIQKQTEKAELFLSVTCKNCTDVMKKFVENDPQGTYWQPIIVPNTSLQKGEEMLKGLGYTGQVYCASESPSGMVPCLKVNSQIYSGATSVEAQIQKIKEDKN